MVAKLEIIRLPIQRHEKDYDDAMLNSLDAVPPEAVLQVLRPFSTALADVKLWLEMLGGRCQARPRAHTRTKGSSASWS